MVKTLPTRPNLHQLKQQAKDLVKAHARRDPTVCDTLRHLHRFAGRTDEEVLRGSLSLHDAQFVLALEYGFPSWNALKQHVEGETGQESGAVLRRENGSVWIDGLPRLAWGTSGDTTFAGALASALSVTRHPVSYSDLMGYSGLAFRVRWYRRTDGPGWCPSSPVGEFPEETRAIERATGWHFDNINRMDLEGGTHMEQFAPRIVEAIDRGLPVVGYADDLNVSVLYGYERGEEGTVFLWNGYMWNEIPHRVPDTGTGPWIMLLTEHVLPPDRRRAFLDAISAPHWRRNEHPAAKVEGKDVARYLMGGRALATWAEDLSHYEEWTEDHRKWLFFVSWWSFQALQDARRQAARFTNDNASLFEGAARSALQRAATVYGETAKTLNEASFEQKHAFLGPWSGKGYEDWTAAMRDREGELLAFTQEQDERARAALDEALAAESQPVR